MRPLIHIAALVGLVVATCVPIYLLMVGPLGLPVQASRWLLGLCVAISLVGIFPASLRRLRRDRDESPVPEVNVPMKRQLTKSVAGYLGAIALLAASLYLASGPLWFLAIALLGAGALLALLSSSILKSALSAPSAQSPGTRDDRN